MVIVMDKNDSFPCKNDENTSNRQLWTNLFGAPQHYSGMTRLRLLLSRSNVYFHLHWWLQVFLNIRMMVVRFHITAPYYKKPTMGLSDCLSLHHTSSHFTLKTCSAGGNPKYLWKVHPPQRKGDVHSCPPIEQCIFLRTLPSHLPPSSNTTMRT